MKKQLNSFRFAGKGIITVLKTEWNFRIHVILTILAIILSFSFQIERTEWMAVIFCIGLVMAAELFNTCIEKITDLVSPGFSEKAGNIKDMAAAAVLLCSIASLAIGLIIFIPKIIDLLKN